MFTSHIQLYYTVVLIVCLSITANGERIFDCTFEDTVNPLCGMRQSSQDSANFDWTLHQGPTASGNTGPDRDHTTNTVNGHYIYLEASDRQPGEFIIIETPQLTRNCGPYEVAFWYHMWGQHVGTLSVEEVYSSGQIDAVWSREKQTDSISDNEWHEQILSITGDARSIRFRASRGGNVQGEPFGDIALDDIIITDSCTSSTTSSTSTTTTTTTTTTAPPSSSSISTQAPSSSTSATPSTTTMPPGMLFRCDFQAQTLCGMEDLVDTVAWSLNKGATPSNPTGPQSDHTFGNSSGYYIFLESSNIGAGVTAKIASPMLNETGEYCLKFYYHMFGQHIGYLKVEEEDDTGNRTQVWLVERDQGDQWKDAEVSLTSNAKRAVITAARGGTIDGQPFGDIAIDDISIRNMMCDATTPEPSTSNTEQPTTATIQDATSSTLSSTTPTTSPTSSAETSQSSTLSSTLSPSISLSTNSQEPSTLSSSTTPSSTSTISMSTSTTTQSTSTTSKSTSTTSQSTSSQSTSTSPSTLKSQTTPSSTTSSTSSISSSSSTTSTRPTRSSTTTLTPSTSPRSSVSASSSTPISSSTITSTTQHSNVQTTYSSSTGAENNTGNEIGIIRSSEATSTTQGPTAEAVNQLWGLEELPWIIILACAGGIILILIIIIIAQACSLHRMKGSRISKLDDMANFENYTRYQKQPPTNGSGPPSERNASGVIYAYENNGYETNR